MIPHNKIKKVHNYLGKDLVGKTFGYAYDAGRKVQDKTLATWETLPASRLNPGAWFFENYFQ
jgi:hypothetical protein